MLAWYQLRSRSVPGSPLEYIRYFQTAKTRLRRGMQSRCMGSLLAQVVRQSFCRQKFPVLGPRKLSCCGQVLGTGTAVRPVPYIGWDTFT